MAPLSVCRRLRDKANKAGAIADILATPRAKLEYRRIEKLKRETRIAQIDRIQVRSARSVSSYGQDRCNGQGMSIRRFTDEVAPVRFYNGLGDG